MQSHEFLRRALNLSLAVYRITDRFPRGEVLTGQLRETGNAIAGDLAEGNLEWAAGKIEKMQIFFQIARKQKWVRPINWSVLDFEYNKLKQEVSFGLEENGEQEGEKEPNIVSHNARAIKKVPRRRALGFADENEISRRQSKILAELETRSALKMSDLIPLFKNQASERTLRNELQGLVKRGMIIKTGFKKSAMYKRK